VAIVSIDGGPTVSSTVGSAIGDNGTPIPAISQLTIVLVNFPAYDGHHHIVVRLPADSEIGDVVEVYRDPAAVGGGAIVFPNVGEAIDDGPVSTGTNDLSSGPVGRTAGPSYGVAFRKISNTHWVTLGAA
jgi:hypothetical protein